MLSPYPNQRHIGDHYEVLGFISSGTYGRVYKAKHKQLHGKGTPAQPPPERKDGRPEIFAIKKYIRLQFSRRESGLTDSQV